MEDDLIKNLTVVLRSDPALDRNRMDMTKYLETRDINLVVEQPGKKAVRFEVRALDVNEWQGVAQQRPGFAMARAALDFGLVSVEGDGLSLRGTKELDTGLGVKRQVMSMHDIQALFARFGAVKLAEIGIIIIDRAEQGNGDGCGVRYTLPQPWPDAQELTARQHAERTRGTSGETPTSATP